jgi:hypothetical protein
VVAACVSRVPCCLTVALQCEWVCEWFFRHI